MPSIPFYALEPDLVQLLEHLNVEHDLAFIVPTGPRRWCAISQAAALVAGPHALWHLPSGPLPLLGRDELEPDVPIPDPFAGWVERVPAAAGNQPFFGSHPGVIWLYLPGFPEPDVVPMSAFGWIGNRYAAIGRPAPTSTAKCWRSLQGWIRRHTVPVARAGSVTADAPEVGAFPVAWERLMAGARAGLNPPAT